GSGWERACEAGGGGREVALLHPPLGSLVPSGEQFTEWVASVREIYDSGDKTAATDITLAGVYGQDYRRFTDGALPAGAFDRAVSEFDTFFQVELGAMQRWNITTEGLKDIRHPVLSMRGRRIGSLKHFWRRPAGPARPRMPRRRPRCTPGAGGPPRAPPPTRPRAAAGSSRPALPQPGLPVATTGILAMLRRKKSVVAGILNKLVVFSIRLMPRPLQSLVMR